MSFAALGLHHSLVAAVAARGYVEPTPVQREAIPLILAGRDLQASAQTGSGKTAAFALPLLQRLHTPPDSPRALQALVLAPTRELAEQIAQVMSDLARDLPQSIKVVTAVGGVSINPQMMALRGGADIVIATPGRLLDLLAHNALSFRGLRTLVLDEADRLLELGFEDELAELLDALPSPRQTLLFSATFPDEVLGLAAQLLRDPARVEIAAGPPAVIQQRAIAVDASRRTQLLRTLIETHGWPQVLVFVATRYSTEHVATKLRRAGIGAVALHGELAQMVRRDALADFKAQRTRVLVATDLAARGIDIAQLPAVVNYDLPRSAVDYVHRIGRTGRAGEEGTAVSFVSAATEAHFRLIEKRHELALPREVIPGFEPVETEVPAAATGGIKGKRKSKKDKLREAAGQTAPVASATPATGFVWPAWRGATKDQT